MNQNYKRALERRAAAGNAEAAALLARIGTTVTLSPEGVANRRRAAALTEFTAAPPDGPLLPVMRSAALTGAYATYALSWDRYVKIGRALDPDRRCRDIAAGRGSVILPRQLDRSAAAVYAVLAPVDVERVLHDALAPHRAEGEWFMDTRSFRKELRSALKRLPF